MNDYIDDKMNYQGWAVADKDTTADYLKKLARQLGQDLAHATEAGLDDMRAIYSAMVDVHGMLQKLELGGDMWRIEICEMADSNVNITELENK